MLLIVQICFVVLGCERSSTPAFSEPPVPGVEPRSTPSSTSQPEEADADAASAWAKPRSDERVGERRAMVRNQIEARGVEDRDVLAAMQHVPRHWFVPDTGQSHAYDDRPLPIGDGQTISQPLIVAMMTAALQLTPDSKVLEVGTGSGYQAAVLSEITPHIYTIEIVKPLGERAITTFKKRGYTTIKTRIGDGYRGWPAFAPFDAIIVTCAPDHIPQPLVEQLSVGGRICIPVGSQRGYQELLVVTKQEDGSLKRTSMIPVRFVPMTGEAERSGSHRD